jgi:hypothetical protein
MVGVVSEGRPFERQLSLLDDEAAVCNERLEIDDGERVT